jgi:hypothetical protein
MSMHTWLRVGETSFNSSRAELRCTAFVCTTCEQNFLHFYNICDNMAHALEIEQIPHNCDTFRFPTELTVRQLTVYRAFMAECEERGPVYENAFHYFKSHNEQPRPPFPKRRKAQ